MSLADKPTIGELRRREERELAYLAPLAEQARQNMAIREEERRAAADPEFDAYLEQRWATNEPAVDPSDPGPDGWGTRDATRDHADAERAEAEAVHPVRAAIQVQAHRLVNGWDFVHGVTDEIEAVWGHDQDILWAKGEPCLLVGPSGVGKSTVAQQLVRAHIDGGSLLGYDVTASAGKILYLAMDRPAQIARSMRRMFGPGWETQLKDRLMVWRGPLPFNIVKTPEALAIMADEFGATTIFVDSVKDLGARMSDEETGSQINAAFQLAIVAGVEVFGIHHQRKAQGDNKKPTTLSDVYGSQMMVNGAGSVILLWGAAGDPVVELSHLKQPMETVGPLTITHDHYRGVTVADDRRDAWQVIEGAWNGLDAVFVAREMFGNPDPTRSEVEKARRRLERLVRDGKARVEEGEKGGRPGEHRPTMWFPVVEDTNHGPITDLVSDRETAGQAITGTYPQAITDQSRILEKSRSSNHGTNHDQSRTNHDDPSPFRERGGHPPHEDVNEEQVELDPEPTYPHDDEDF